MAVDSGPAIKSVTEFLERVNSLYEKRGFGGKSSKRERWESLWFRGQSHESWKLQPKLYRPEYKAADESEIRQEFQSKAIQLIQQRIPKSPYEWYFLMQHYGVRTRLLDWTDDPLIALYFAIEKIVRRANATVWVLDPQAWNNALGMTFSGPLLPEWQEAKQWLFDLEVSFSTTTTFSQEHPAAIDPPHVDRRLAAQGSHFVIFGRIREMTKSMRLINRGEKDAKQHAWLAQIEIDIQHRPKILEQLRRYGVSRFRVFPDLESLGRDVAEKWREA